MKRLRGIPWCEPAIIMLFIVRCLYIWVPRIKVPGIAGIRDEYTYDTVYYFLCSSLIELGVVYILHKKYRNSITYGLCLLGIGNVIDQFTSAAVKWNLSSIIWVSVVVVYTCVTWKRNRQ